MLRDQDRLRQILAIAHRAEEKGRHIALMTLTAEGALAVLEGNRAFGANRFGEAVELAQQVWPVLLHPFLYAAAAAYLGIEDPEIADLARQAHEVLAGVGATNLMEILSDGLLAPDQEVSQAG